ncbi:MAG: S8 family serine peptidase [Candidatus Riflebacteria bacterium]|nr:S8 family serine peptidase [Candidatus Riflebacteria bacterium]
MRKKCKNSINAIIVTAFFSAFFSVSASCQTFEIPCQPFEPVYTGPEYSYEELSQFYNTRTASDSLPNDPFLTAQWYLHNFGQPDDKQQNGIPGCDINVFNAWQAYNPKKEIILAILDSGLDLKHEDINQEVLWVNKGESGTDENGNDKSTNGLDDDQNGYIDDLHGWNFQRKTPVVQDDQYHGTHITSLLCAKTNNSLGISGGFPFVKIMLVKIFGIGSNLTSEEIASAVKYAVDNGAMVLSNSYGTPSYTDAMKKGIEYSASKGALFVCASGNSRKNMELPEEKDYPSCYGIENQLVVGAVNNRNVSTFANFGNMVEISAPGENIFSLMPGSKYRSFSGSSQACPMVAAAAAMIWSQNPEWTWRDVKNSLIKGADQIRGLSKYVKNGLTLNVGNSIKNLEGKRLPEYDFSKWQTKDYAIESQHPYWNGKLATFTVAVEGAKRFRMHFTNIEMEHNGDSLEILDETGNQIEYLNGIFGECWSEVIEGSSAQLILTANDYVNAWGFKIDRIQFQGANNR